MNDTLFAKLVDIGVSNKLPVKKMAILRHTVWTESQMAVGLASTVNTGGHDSVADAGSFFEKKICDLAPRFLSETLIDRAIGLASINASCDYQKILQHAQTGNAFDLIKRECMGKNVAVIGGFPNVARMRQTYGCKNLWVFELNPNEGEVGPEKYGDLLPEADIVLMTGTTVINHSFATFHQYLNKSLNVMVGPSTPMHSIMFDYGVHILAGTVVSDRNLAWDYLSQGAAYREAKGLLFVNLCK